MLIELVERADHRTNSLVDSNQKPILNQFFNSMTSLGSAYFTLILIGAFWSFGDFWIAQKLGTGLLLAGAVIFSLKYAAKRQRPENHIENIFSRASFPSGHSGNSFMTATILSSALGSTAGFFSLAFTVAASRVYLEDHYLSDVIAGSAIGFIIGQILITV